MALNANKEKQLSHNRRVNNTRACMARSTPANNHLIGKQSTLMKKISFGGVTKSWGAPPRHCNPVRKSPWLQLSRCKEESGKNPHPRIFNIQFHQGIYQWYLKGHYCDPWTQFVGYSQGVLVARGNVPSDHYLWDPLKNNYLVYPP